MKAVRVKNVSNFVFILPYFLIVFISFLIVLRVCPGSLVGVGQGFGTGVGRGLGATGGVGGVGHGLGRGAGRGSGGCGLGGIGIDGFAGLVISAFTGFSFKATATGCRTDKSFFVFIVCMRFYCFIFDGGSIRVCN
jgi:hypothetical protein